MDIGSGIAVAGVWVMVGMLGLSKTVTGIGYIVGVIAASLVTCFAIFGAA